MGGTGSFVNLKLAYLARLTGHDDLRIPHFHSPSNEITDSQSHAQLLHVSGGSQTQVLVLVWQILYQLSHCLNLYMTTSKEAGRHPLHQMAVQ